ncbi:MAG: hypothetical protein IT306_17245 [Chloroflexi bacterium]|nr:hypothetical protein [Chloroflexota bacterium]
MERRFGPYLLGQPLAATPFGELVSATHTARSQPLALLLLAPALSADHRFRGLVRLEIARVGGMRMAGLGRAVEIVEQAGTLAVVYECPPDSTPLTTGDGIGDGLPAVAAVALIERLAAVLDAAHGRRIVHGVLGPNVVLLGADGAVALIGLGLLGAVEEAGLGGSALAPETPPDGSALAPEQREGTLAVATADGYALGTLAARLLPAPNADLAAVLTRQQADAPAQRFPSCAAFASALAEAVSLAPTAPQPAPAAQTTTTSPNTPPTPTSPSTDAAPVSIISPPATRPSELHLPPQPAAQAGGTLPSSPPRPSAPPTETPSPAPPATPSPAPTATPSRAPTATPSPAPTAHTAAPTVSVTRLTLTPAMLACRKAHRPLDQTSSLVMTAARWMPPLDQVVEQYAPNGWLGPIPLGLAVLGTFSLLLLLLGLSPLMGIVVAVTLGVYGLPPLIAKLTAGEQPPVEVVRVRGGLRACPEYAGITVNAFRLEGPDGQLAPLPAAAFQYAASIGQPLTDQRWSSRGTEFIPAGYLLPDHAATVLLPDRLLLDLRDATDTVLYRHPAYPGEPRDRATPALLSDAVVPPGQRSTPYGPPMSAPTWTPTPTGRLLVQVMPPALATELGAAFTRTAWIAAGLNGVPIALLILASLVNQFQFLLLAATVVIVGFIGLPKLQRVWQLSIARRAPAIVRASGDVYVRTYNPPGQIKGQQSHRYGLRLDDGNELRTTKELFNRLARDGQFVPPEAAPDLWAARKGEGDTLTVRGASGVAVVFEPLAGLLLEACDRSGQLVYRDPAASELALRPPPEIDRR